MSALYKSVCFFPELGLPRGFLYSFLKGRCYLWPGPVPPGSPQRFPRPQPRPRSKAEAVKYS